MYKTFPNNLDHFPFNENNSIFVISQESLKGVAKKKGDKTYPELRVRHNILDRNVRIDLRHSLVGKRNSLLFHRHGMRRKK